MIPNLLGNVPNWHKIYAIAKKFNLKVIEDSLILLDTLLKVKILGPVQIL